jgi:hypothetical protein
VPDGASVDFSKHRRRVTRPPLHRCGPRAVAVVELVEAAVVNITVTTGARPDARDRARRRGSDEGAPGTEAVASSCAALRGCP